MNENRQIYMGAEKLHQNFQVKKFNKPRFSPKTKNIVFLKNTIFHKHLFFYKHLFARQFSIFTAILFLNKTTYKITKSMSFPTTCAILFLIFIFVVVANMAERIRNPGRLQSNQLRCTPSSSQILNHVCAPPLV